MIHSVLSKCSTCWLQTPQEVLWISISSDGDDRRIFLGLKFSFLGFFLLGWLDLSWDFLSIQNNLKIFRVTVHLLILSGNF